MATNDSAPRNDEPTLASRRAFLTGAGAAAVAGLTAAACSPDSIAEKEPVAAPDATSTETTPEPLAATEPLKPATINFHGEHQAGILLPPAPAGLVAAFDVVSADRAALIVTLQDLSAEIERLMTNQPLDQEDDFLPPIDSGAIDAQTGTAGVTVTLGVGASLFDDRFGLTELRPSELITMPRFFNDRLVSNDISHGDLQLTIGAPNQQAAVFALHQVVRVTERRLRVRWVQEGYNQLLPDQPGQLAETRNLMGFRDGTSNLDVANAAEMANFVWVGSDDDEPAWAVGGTYQATRVIRMLIEFWATAALVRQEQIFGRHRDTGAPIGQEKEGDIPTFVSDPTNELIPQRAHMRLANPRTPNTGRILRRGFSYLNGADDNGTLDQGLIFICYQRSLRRGFLEVQSRLDGEPLEDYIKPVGGGLFFVLPGPSSDGWLGESLFV